MIRINEILKEKINVLRKNGIADAREKVILILQHELNMTKETILVHGEYEIEQEVQRKIENDIQQIVKGMPVQYITGVQGFFGLEFCVSKDVLIPQPDTEVLVQEAINLVSKYNLKQRILDICTGSGAIAISLGKNLDNEIVASDISKEALEIAKKNAKKNCANIEFVCSNMFENIEGNFDMIVSNPPYIETETIKKLDLEVQNEPRLALDGGEDGLEFYRILTSDAKKHLNDGGFLIVEIGYNQRKEVVEFFENAGFYEIDSKKDYAGNDRIVIGKLRK